MNLRPLTFIMAVFLFTSQLTHAQKFADKDNYLLDSLDLSSFNITDRNLLDSCLEIYHKAEEDTTKIDALGYICDNMIDARWKDYQQFQYEYIKELIQQEQYKSALNKRYILAIFNMGWAEIYNGNYEISAAYYNEILEYSKQNNYTHGLAMGYSGLAYGYRLTGDLDTALQYFLNANDAFEKLDKEDGEMANNLVNIGEVYRMKSNYFQAMSYYNQSLDLYKKNENDYERATCLNNIGLVQNQLGNIKETINLYEQSLKIYQKLGHKEAEATVLINIGEVVYSQNNFDDALSFYQQAFEILKKNKMKKVMAYCLNNMAGVYNRKKEYKKAIDYYNESKEIEESLGDEIGVARCNTNIANNYIRLENFPEALIFSNEALAIYSRLNLKYESIKVYVNLSRIYKSSSSEKEKMYAEKALNMAKELKNVNSIREASLVNYEMLAGENKFEEALDMHLLYIEMRDSVKNQENKNLSIKAKVEYDFNNKTLQLRMDNNQKTMDLKLQKAKNENQWYLTALLVIAIMVLVFIVLWRRSTYKLNLRTFEQSILKSQVKPHMIFNLLTSVQSLIIQKKNKEATMYLAQVAHFVRTNLNILTIAKTTLREELELLEQYLKLEKLRFNEKLTYTIVNNCTEQNLNMQLPVLILQPIVENAIIHGFKERKGVGHISIDCVMQKDKLHITIFDNGIGISDKAKSESKGMNIVRKRMQLDNSKNEFIIHQPETGTKIELIFVHNLS